MIEPPSPDVRQTCRPGNVRRPNTGFVLCESSVRPIEVWTRSVSGRRADIMSHVELLGERVMLRLNLPDYAGKLIEAQVRHRSRFDRALVNGDLETMFYCGLDYIRVWEETRVHPSLLAAFNAPASGRPGERGSQSRIADRSLVPLLSAVGMPVVYATMLPWG